MTFSLNLKKVVDQTYMLDLKSEFADENEYFFAMYYMMETQRQYARSVIQQSKIQVNPEILNMQNFAPVMMKHSKDSELAYHIMLMAVMNTLIQPLRKKIKDRTGADPEPPFDTKKKTSDVSFPELDPKRV